MKTGYLRSTILFTVFLILTWVHAEASAPQVERFLNMPRPVGASLRLNIEMRDDPPYSALLDYRIEGQNIDIRLQVLDGDMTNQGLLLRIREDSRQNEYYRYHPLLGTDIISKSQLMRQFKIVGFHLNDLLFALNPESAWPRNQWTSRRNDEHVIILSPPNSQDCRTEYKFQDSALWLPHTVRLCRGTSSPQATIELQGKVVFDEWVFPKLILYKDGDITYGRIEISLPQKKRWTDASIFQKDSFNSNR